jgi:pimeloyl-ACP methyl ester carboxylesterase
MSESPFWFQRALDTPSTPGDVEVAGANIHFETWGEVGNPGIALIHGSNAHLEWWRFVAPFLADQFRVVALDSSGNGDSGWREKYTGELLAAEVIAVCEAAELGPKPVIAGHSFGGFTVLETGHFHGSSLGGIIFQAPVSTKTKRSRWVASAMYPNSPWCILRYATTLRKKACAKSKAAGPGNSILVCSTIWKWASINRISLPACPAAPR